MPDKKKESFLDQFAKTSKVWSAVTKKMKDAGVWFRKKVKNLGNNRDIPKDERRDLLNRFEKMDKPTIGSMVLYFYDPKHAKTLPYYDRFPLGIIVGPVERGFHSLNLHYLHPTLRARLFDALLDLSTDERLTQQRRLEISYQILKDATKLKPFRPCFKRYLTSHVRSNIVIVPPEEWSNVLFLPLQQFEKATDAEVWKDSERIIKKY
jgi:hypothetical protein